MSPVTDLLGGDLDDSGSLTRARKAPNAFRTISEVADELNIPQHVLRFWEGKFNQVKPLKRGGGRRYYRPDDIALLRRIADLLYTQGYTIKGVQRLLRETGGKLEGKLSPPMEQDLGDGEDELLIPTPALFSLEPVDMPSKPADLRKLLVQTLRELEELRRLLG